MKVLFEAIYGRWESEEKLGLTELYNTEASADAVFPYGVFSLPDTTPGRGEFGVDWEDCLIHFNLFSEATLATEVCAVFEALKLAFDHYDLTPTGYTPITMERELANIFRVEKIWQCSVTYRLLIEKG